MLKRWNTFRAKLLTVVCLAILAVAAALALSASSSGPGARPAAALGAPATITNESDFINAKLPTYLEWLATRAKGYQDAPASAGKISLAASDYAAISSAELLRRDGDRVDWQDGESWIEYKLTVPADGLYELGVVYDTSDDRSTDIVRGVEIDGQTPYAEAATIRLKHAFAQAVYPFERDDFGNDVLPQAQDRPGERETAFYDYAASAAPLKWYLAKGEHRIRLTNQQGAITLISVFAEPPAAVPTYEEARRSYPAAAGQPSTPPYLQRVEAENIASKSNTSIQLQALSDAKISPDAKGLLRFNAIGGESFKTAGQWIEWEVDAPQDGQYELGFKYKQAFLNNSYAFESVQIDGRTPFRELQTVAFPYSKAWDWENQTLADADGTPYAFYLTKGKHRIRVTATSAPIKPVYEGLLRNLSRIAALDQEIRKVTGNYEKSYNNGGNTDASRDWQLEKYIPNLQERLVLISKDLSALADELAGVTLGESDVESAFRGASSEFLTMSGRIAKIPGQMQLFETTQQNLSNWAFRLLDQPLMFDYLWIAEPGAKLPQASPGGWGKAVNTVRNFYRSFVTDYDFTYRDPQAIDVWVTRGRNYVQMLQKLADESFTPQTGIHVNVNMITDPNVLIMSNLSGKQPDVALGLDSATVMDFAMRGTLADLSQFPGYEQSAGQFSPGALGVLSYDGGRYGMPETQGFKVLMYRTDILERLGLSPPSTWDDVTMMLPTLQQNGYDFYVPNDYLPFIYQNGAELYSQDGLSSGLDTEAAFKGFQQWTQLFTLYQVPKEVPSFFNHFRLGDIPIGIADFNNYLLTLVAAPEIAGKWAIAPIPGNEDAEGEVERWAGGPLQAGVVYQASAHRDAAWQFLNWWTSEQTQSRFGNDIEAVYGPEYRWNTANEPAFDQLPWSRQDLSVIRQQRAWYKEAPQLPGGYFTSRQLTFAWQNVVASSSNPREELDKAVQEIDREMSRKQVEFGLRDSLGRVLHPLSIPDIPKPAKGDQP